jgi:two-component system sensor histidine kinase ChiS
MLSPQVLVVEDDPELNQMVCAYASMAGFTFRSALNGTDALAEIERDAPAAIVLDLMLPDMSGFDICDQLKCGAMTMRIPIIILTALDSDASRQRGVDCGAAAYLTKPFDPDELIRTIRHHARVNGTHL